MENGIFLLMGIPNFEFLFFVILFNYVGTVTESATHLVSLMSLLTMDNDTFLLTGIQNL